MENKDLTPAHKGACIELKFLSLQACFLLLLLLVLTGRVFAAESVNQSYGKVWRISGRVTASFGESAVPRTLQTGESIYMGERIHADAGGEAVLQTSDSGYIALRAGSTFLVDKYEANKKETDRISIRLIQGGLRLLSGWIGKLNPNGYRVLTPSGTIGIRGTDHEPYVVTEELAITLSQPAGTYDKVNTGGTVLEVNSKSVGIDPGRVGFARLAKPAKDRALITLTMPIILEKVPDFFVSGQFDAELDAVSSQDIASTVLSDTDREVTEQPVAVAASSQIPARRKDGRCNASGVAKAWLVLLDAALARKDSSGVLSLFTADATIRSVVKTKSGGTTTVSIGRDEFAASASAMLESLSDYKQSRPSITGSTVRPGHCEAVSVKSLTVEQGRRNGKAFSFVSVEEYQLELKDGNWMATQASTVQQ